jgi:hypothetical protein
VQYVTGGCVSGDDEFAEQAADLVAAQRDQPKAVRNDPPSTVADTVRRHGLPERPLWPLSVHVLS